MKHRIVDSPLGPLTLVVNDSGALQALSMADQKWGPEPDADLGERDDTVAADAVAQLAEYFAGTRTAFDLALAPVGTDFQRGVWAALGEIPFGTTETYGRLAERIGHPRGTRAVGAATGRNPIGIIIPCHRLVGASGGLTGYAGGLDRKRWLLDFESGGVLV
ncbi:MAG TPA: methylated-DNA--[protein]-cysteine S-methyltransferase [Propioniciclava tarda]|nr:methylated-DNA--[protein]-cysteine S-methyltransferase [Propioniciclava tarda]